MPKSAAPTGCPSRTSPRLSHSFGGKYLELVPHERIRHTDKFDDPNLPGEMQTTVSLKKVSCGTEVNIVQEGVPEAIPPEACLQQHPRPLFCQLTFEPRNRLSSNRPFLADKVAPERLREWQGAGLQAPGRAACTSSRTDRVVYGGPNATQTRVSALRGRAHG